MYKTKSIKAPQFNPNVYYEFSLEALIKFINLNGNPHSTETMCSLNNYTT